MLSLTPKPRGLRSSGFHLLAVPRVKTHAGTPAFSIAIPILWNSFPEHVKYSTPVLGAPLSSILLEDIGATIVVLQ